MAQGALYFMACTKMLDSTHGYDAVDGNYVVCMYLATLIISSVLCSMLRMLTAAAAVVWGNQQSRNTPVALRAAMCHRTSVTRMLACKLLLIVCDVRGCLIALQNPAQNSVRQPVQQQRPVKARRAGFISLPQAPNLSWRCWHALRRSSHSVSSTPVVPGRRMHV